MDTAIFIGLITVLVAPGLILAQREVKRLIKDGKL